MLSDSMYIEGNWKIDDYHTGGKMEDCIITLEALCNTSCLLYTAALKVLALIWTTLALNKPTAQHHWCHGVMTVLRRDQQAQVRAHTNTLRGLNIKIN